MVTGRLAPSDFTFTEVIGWVMDTRYHPSGTVGVRCCESCGEAWPETLASLIEESHGAFIVCPACRPEWF